MILLPVDRETGKDLIWQHEDAYFSRIIFSGRYPTERLYDLKDTYDLEEVEYMHLMIDMFEDSDNSVRYIEPKT